METRTRACAGTQWYLDGADVDADSDGFLVCDGDCDDADPDAYPGAPEICEDDGDQDCDGTEAEGGDPECAGCADCSGALAGAAPTRLIGMVLFCLLLLGCGRRWRPGPA